MLAALASLGLISNEANEANILTKLDMSRVGKQSVVIPSGVEFKLDGRKVQVKGPKGELSLLLHDDVQVEQSDGSVSVTVKNSRDSSQRALWGLFQRLIQNMVVGVTDGYQKQLEVNGVGYKMAVSGDTLTLNVGYSHPVEFKLPKGVEAAIEKKVITLTGIDKQQVGEIAAQIRRVRPPEPYKGKGIKYVDEVVRRKAGKQAK